MEIPYTLIRSSRKTISIQITDAGEVVVRCPNRAARREVEAVLDSKADWIQRHLQKHRERPRQPELTREELLALAAQAKEVLPRRAAYFAGKMGLQYGRITIRAQHSRWGSCSVKGNLNFNCLLMLCPAEVQDYVVVHELCHLRELNHSSRFWELVGQTLPDYPTRRAWLKNQGNDLIARLPKQKG